MTKTMTLNETINSMKKRKDKGHFSLNDLMNTINESKENGVEVVRNTPDAPPLDEVPIYNDVPQARPVYTQNTFGYTNRNSEFSKVIKDYLNSQMEVVQEYESQMLKKELGQLGLMDPNQYLMFERDLSQYICNLHHAKLAKLHQYMTSLNPNELSTFQYIAVEEQVTLMNYLQKDKMSPAKKKYLAEQSAISNKIRQVEEDMRLAQSRGDLDILEQLNSSYNKLMYDKNKSVQEFSGNSFQQQPAQYQQPVTRTGNPFLDGATTLQQPDPSYNIGNNNVLSMIGAAAPVQDDGFTKINDMEFNRFYSKSSNNRYVPYDGPQPTDHYASRNNYLSNGATNGMYNVTETLAYKINKHIQYLRSIGYVPSSFGIPSSNEDYVDQLIWVTPVPDPNQYYSYQTPHWKLDYVDLGYKSYVEANKEVLKVHKFEVSFNKSDKTIIKTKPIFTKPKVVAPIVFKIGKSDIDKVEVKEEPNSVLTNIDFSSAGYVRELDALDYLPDEIVKYLNSIRAKDLDDFCRDGIMYLYKYKVFVPLMLVPAVTKNIEKHIELLEEELIERKLNQEKAHQEYLKNLDNTPNILDIIEDEKLDEVEKANEIKSKAEQELNSAKIPDELLAGYGEDVNSSLFEYEPEDEDYTNWVTNKDLDKYKEDNGRYKCNGFDMGAVPDKREDASSLSTLNIDQQLAKLKATLKTNIKSEAFNSMGMVERLSYLIQETNDFHDVYDTSDLKPGVHKFFTNRGIYIIDNRDLSVKASMPVDTLSPEVARKYLPNQKRVVSKDLLYDRFILPRMKPEDKEIYKDPKIEEQVDVDQHLKDINTIREHDCIELNKWVMNNGSPELNMNEYNYNLWLSTVKHTAKVRNALGNPENYDKLTYSEWAALMDKNSHKIFKPKRKKSSKVLQIYNVISELDYTNTQYSANKAIDEDQRFIEYNPETGEMEHIAPRQYDIPDVDIDVFKDRFGHNCSLLSTDKEKCYSTYTSGDMEMEPPENSEKLDMMSLEDFFASLG